MIRAILSCKKSIWFHCLSWGYVARLVVIPYHELSTYQKFAKTRGKMYWDIFHLRENKVRAETWERKWFLFQNRHNTPVHRTTQEHQVLILSQNWIPPGIFSLMSRRKASLLKISVKQFNYLSTFKDPQSWRSNDDAALSRLRIAREAPGIWKISHECCYSWKLFMWANRIFLVTVTSSIPKRTRNVLKTESSHTSF